MNILQRIFHDHYEEIIYLLHTRPVEIENIDKMINCGNPSYGGALYGCPHCSFMKYAIVVSVLPAAINTLCSVLPVCLSNWSILYTATVSLLLMNASDSSSLTTVPFSTVFSMPLDKLYPLCSSG